MKARKQFKNQLQGHIKDLDESHRGRIMALRWPLRILFGWRVREYIKEQLQQQLMETWT